MILYRSRTVTTTVVLPLNNILIRICKRRKKRTLGRWDSNPRSSDSLRLSHHGQRRLSEVPYTPSLHNTQRCRWGRHLCPTRAIGRSLNATATLTNYPSGWVISQLNTGPLDLPPGILLRLTPTQRGIERARQNLWKPRELLTESTPLDVVSLNVSNGRRVEKAGM